MSDLATTVASMGKWIKCPEYYEMLPGDGGSCMTHCKGGCQGTGKVWEYALSEQVRVISSPCWGKGYRNPCQGRPVEDADCPYCHGLGWTASKDLAVWFEEGRDYDLELVRGSNAYDHQLEHKRWVGRAISVHKFRRIEVGSDNVQEAGLSALREALQSEGYTVHPDMEKVGQTP